MIKGSRMGGREVKREGVGLGVAAVAAEGAEDVVWSRPAAAMTRLFGRADS